MIRNSIRIVALTITTVALTFAMAHLALAQTIAEPAASAPVGDARRGKDAFMKYGCYECHGTGGQGNYGTGVRIAPKPPPWSAVNSYVRRPRGGMPSYSEKILADGVLADIYVYLSSIPAGKLGSDIPLLSDTTLKPK